MLKETEGIIVSVHRIWWDKVKRQGNPEPVYAHRAKISYMVQGKKYRGTVEVPAGLKAPLKGGTAEVLYEEEQPQKAAFRIR